MRGGGSAARDSPSESSAAAAASPSSVEALAEKRLYETLPPELLPPNAAPGGGGAAEQSDYVGEFVRGLVERTAQSHIASKLDGKVLMLDKRAAAWDQRRVTRHDERRRRRAPPPGALGKKAARRAMGGAAPELVPESARKWSCWLPLHETWEAYAAQALGRASGPAEMASALTALDLGGAIVVVVRSARPSLVGTRGIVLLETLNCLNVVTQADALVSIPKPRTSFHLTVGPDTFLLARGVCDADN